MKRKSLFYLQHWTKFFRLFYVLTQFHFTASETELGYFHQKWNVEVTERLKAEDLTKLGNFKKTFAMLEIDGSYPAGHPNCKF